MNKEVIKNWVLSHPKLVSMKESVSYPGLFVLKYSRKVFYDSLWNDYLVNMRGLVVDSDFNIIVRPFTKIFNRYENGVDIPLDSPVKAVRKVNGFMGAVTRDPKYGMIYSTTGSIDSEYAKLVQSHLGDTNPLQFKEGFTYLFEICDESDPHIITENFGAYLLEVQQVSWDNLCPFSQSYLDEIAYNLGVMRPEHKTVKFIDVVNELKTCKHEGYVVHQLEEPFTVLKMKSPHYLTSKFIARMKSENLEKMLETGSWKEKVDEEFYPLFEYLTENKEFVKLEEQDRLSEIRKFLGDEQ